LRTSSFETVFAVSSVTPATCAADFQEHATQQASTAHADAVALRPVLIRPGRRRSPRGALRGPRPPPSSDKHAAPWAREAAAAAVGWSG
jgi:hypothetical protein